MPCCETPKSRAKVMCSRERRGGPEESMMMVEWEARGPEVKKTKTKK